MFFFCPPAALEEPTWLVHRLLRLGKVLTSASCRFQQLLVGAAFGYIRSLVVDVRITV